MQSAWVASSSSIMVMPSLQGTNTMAAGILGIEVAGIVPGARGNAPVRIAERLGGIFLHRIDQFGVEMGRRLAPDQNRSATSTFRRAAIPATAARKSLSSVSMIAASGAPAIDGERDLAGNHIARGIGDHGLADRADRLGAVLAGNPLHRKHEPGKRRQRVAAERHRRRAGIVLGPATRR